MTARRVIALAALTGLLQVGFLGWSIMSRAAILRDGREIVMKVEPIDPRDLLRGDYVRLGYQMGSIDTRLLEAPLVSDRTYTGGETVWVRLKRNADGFWEPLTVRVDQPFEQKPGENQADIKGKMAKTYSRPGKDFQTLPVEYGIERFYLPEDTGHQIEIDMRERPFFVKLALANDGTAQIKQFLDGEKVLFEEPLY